jgi:hypothetical protein
MKDIIVIIALLLAMVFAVAYFTHKCEVPQYVPNPEIDILKQDLAKKELLVDSLISEAMKHKQNADNFKKQLYENEQYYEEKLEELSNYSNSQHATYFINWTGQRISAN